MAVPQVQASLTQLGCADHRRQFPAARSVVAPLELSVVSRNKRTLGATFFFTSRHNMGEWVGGLGAGGGAAGGGSAVGQEYEVGGRRLRVIRQLGEGGYSFVYLVKLVQGDGLAAASPGTDTLYALKRVIASP